MSSSSTNSPNDVSFLPDDYLEGKAQRRANIICAALFLVVMVAVGGAFSVTERSTREIDRQHEAKLREYTAEAKRIQQAEKMQDKQRTMARQAELAASLLEKVPRSFVLAEFTNSLPAGVSLLDLTMESKKRTNKETVAPPGSTAFETRKAAEAARKLAEAAKAQPQQQAPAYDVSIRVTGIAYNNVQVAQFMKKLTDSPLLKDVALVITDQVDVEGETLRKFQIECMLDPAAEVNPDDARPGDTKTVAVEMGVVTGGGDATAATTTTK